MKGGIMAYLGENIPKLGFGLMRLPKIGEGENEHSDVETTKKMVDAFLQAGFAYFDTAWGYGDSEDTIRQALVERYPRESFQLATKLAAWIDCETREDAIAQFETSLERTGAGYFDFYLLHNVGTVRTAYFDKFNVWDFVQEQKAAGKIKHIGFSFHSTAEELEEVLTAHPEAEFAQLQINWADWDSPSIQSRACYEVARKHNKPVIIMEPVKGGYLADPPRSVKTVFDCADATKSYSAWALQFAADLDGLITVLSGMSTLEQMEENIQTMKGFTGLTADERATIAKAQEELKKIPVINCTTCDYCAKTCPQHIGISGTFSAMNLKTLYNNMGLINRELFFKIEHRGLKHATECIECGACENACPQQLPIISELKRCVEVLDLRNR